MSDEAQADQFVELRTKKRAELDRYMADLAAQTEAFLAGDRTQIQWVTNYIDTWQHVKGKIAQLGFQLGRHLADQRDRYEELMRKSKANPPRGEGLSFHYEERLAKYEITHMEDGRRLRILDELAVEVKAASWAFDAKIRWLEDMRRHMKRVEDDFRYASAKDHQGS